MNWANKALHILNLSKTEVRILNTLTHPKNVQDIAKESGVSRTGVNHALGNLSRKGLVDYQTQGKRRVYASATSEQVSEKFQEVLNEIETANRKGAKVKTSKEDEFIIHVGAKEIVPAFERIASEIKNERVKAIQHHRSFNDQIEVATPEQIVNFNQTIIKNGIIVDGILNENAYISYRKEIEKDPEKFKDQIKSLEGRMSDYSVFPDNRFNHDAEIWIFKKTTLIINWKEKIAIEITNKNMTSFLREMFEYVKQSTKKIDHNAEMRKILTAIQSSLKS